MWHSNVFQFHIAKKRSLCKLGRSLVAYDNSTWHAVNTRYINSTKETSHARWSYRRRLLSVVVGLCCWGPAISVMWDVNCSSTITSRCLLILQKRSRPPSVSDFNTFVHITCISYACVHLCLLVHAVVSCTLFVFVVCEWFVYLNHACTSELPTLTLWP